MKRWQMLIITSIVNHTLHSGVLDWLNDGLNTISQVAQTTSQPTSQITLPPTTNTPLVVHDEQQKQLNVTQQESHDCYNQNQNIIEKKTDSTDGKNINVYVTVNNATNAQTNVSQEARLNATQQQSVMTYLKALNFNDVTNNLKNYGNDGMNFFWHYKYRTFLGLLAAVYTSISYNLISIYGFLTATTCWANWKNHCTLEHLYSLSQTELQRELLRDIQTSYMNTQNPTDSISPLVAFVQSIEQERKYITRYKKITSWLSRLYLLPFFPTNIQKISFIHDQEARLLFVKHIFVSWSAEHNVIQVVHKDNGINSACSIQ